MMKQYPFAHTRSVYPLQLDDPKAVVLHVDGLTPDAEGVYDVTERLQTLLDSVKQQDKRGIVLIPEGTYSVSRTIYLPRAVRMIGFGKNRPKFVLKKNTPGFQKAPQEDKGGGRVHVLVHGQHAPGGRAYSRRQPRHFLQRRLQHQLSN